MQHYTKFRQNTDLRIYSQEYLHIDSKSIAIQTKN